MSTHQKRYHEFVQRTPPGTLIFHRQKGFQYIVISTSYDEKEDYYYCSYISENGLVINELVHEEDVDYMIESENCDEVVIITP